MGHNGPPPNLIPIREVQKDGFELAAWKRRNKPLPFNDPWFEFYWPKVLEECAAYERSQNKGKITIPVRKVLR